MTRDWHGITRSYEHAGGTATSLKGAVQALKTVVLDAHGVRAAWGEVDDPYATVLAGVRQAACRPRAPRALEDWAAAFEREVARIAALVPNSVLALGGGLDGAAVLVAWRASGHPMPHVMTLATGLPGYDEVEDARAIAAHAGVPLEVVTATPAELIAMTPEAVRAIETPLYNLHPVHRLAIARAAARRGAWTLVTGDGADSIFAGAPDLDYVPLVAALARCTGLAHCSPFLADVLVDGTEPDPTKGALRVYLRARGLAWLADRPKKLRRLPAFALAELAPIHDAGRVEALSRGLGLPPRLDDDRRRTGWVTLDHLVRFLEAP